MKTWAPYSKTIKNFKIVTAEHGTQRRPWEWGPVQLYNRPPVKLALCWVLSKALGLSPVVSQLRSGLLSLFPPSQATATCVSSNNTLSSILTPEANSGLRPQLGCH